MNAKRKIPHKGYWFVTFTRPNYPSVDSLNLAAAFTSEISEAAKALPYKLTANEIQTLAAESYGFLQDFSKPSLHIQSSVIGDRELRSWWDILTAPSFKALSNALKKSAGDKHHPSISDGWKAKNPGGAKQRARGTRDFKFPRFVDKRSFHSEMLNAAAETRHLAKLTGTRLSSKEPGNHGFFMNLAKDRRRSMERLPNPSKYPKYPFYVADVYGRIWSGWEFKEDAKEFVKEYPSVDLRVYTAKGWLRTYMQPDYNEDSFTATNPACWITQEKMLEMINKRKNPGGAKQRARGTRYSANKNRTPLQEFYQPSGISYHDRFLSHAAEVRKTIKKRPGDPRNKARILAHGNLVSLAKDSRKLVKLPNPGGAKQRARGTRLYDPWPSKDKYSESIASAEKNRIDYRNVKRYISRVADQDGSVPPSWSYAMGNSKSAHSKHLKDARKMRRDSISQYYHIYAEFDKNHPGYPGYKREYLGISVQKYASAKEAAADFQPDYEKYGGTVKAYTEEEYRNFVFDTSW